MSQLVLVGTQKSREELQRVWGINCWVVVDCCIVKPQPPGHRAYIGRGRNNR